LVNNVQIIKQAEEQNIPMTTTSLILWNICQIFFNQTYLRQLYQGRNVA